MVTIPVRAVVTCERLMPSKTLTNVCSPRSPVFIGLRLQQICLHLVVTGNERANTLNVSSYAWVDMTSLVPCIGQ
jgi:hypothetical protein